MPEADEVPLYTAAQVREMDRLAIECEGIPGYTLMCRAGESLARHVEYNWPQVKQVCIVCGPGNNAGDGYVLARLLAARGRDVEVQAVCDPDRLQGDARQAADEYVAGGGAVQAFDGPLPVQAGLLVDALLGSGLDRNVEGNFLQAIKLLNAHAAPVVAVDIPSGLHADTGHALGIAVTAHSTVTFIGRKRGLYTGDGVRCAGHILYDSLDVPDTVRKSPAAVHTLGPAPLEHLSVPRARNAHKGDFGHVLVVGGGPGLSGAARLAAEASARCGAGLVSVATAPQHAACLNAGRPELMVHAVDNPDRLSPLLRRAGVVAIGPGLGRSDWARALFERVLESRLPLVVDADALNLLAADPLKRDNWVLTPHPGEAARLLQITSAGVQCDRFSAVNDLQSRFGGVAVLKGAGSLVASGAGELGLCVGGNPGMASGGMGDVLTGVIAALVAQGMSPAPAARAGVCLHARAADFAASERGERGLLASDLIPVMRELINGRS